MKGKTKVMPRFLGCSTEKMTFSEIEKNGEGCGLISQIGLNIFKAIYLR